MSDHSLHSSLRIMPSTSNSKQDEKTAEMIIKTFNMLSLKKNGVSAKEIADYLRVKYGNVWRISKLVAKTQDILERRSMLGFLEKRGDGYIAIEKRVKRVLQGHRHSHMGRCRHSEVSPCRHSGREQRRRRRCTNYKS